ncbi:MAG: glycosyltransferase [Nocardiopsaceae bacterium]|nr:glycosyltransferase [Nocardiopsaceae bacterium]
MSPGTMPPDRYVLTWVSTAPGGAERSVAELATTLCSGGHQVHVVLWDQAGRTLSPALPLPFDLTLVTDFAAYRQALDQALAPGAMALISTHRTATVDIDAARPHGVVVLPVLRALLLDQGRLRMLDPATGHLRATPLPQVDWDAWARAHCWVGVSAAATRSLTHHAPRPIRALTIHNGVAADHLPFSTPGRVRRAAVVARLEEWKRIDRVIDAYAALPSWARDRMRLDVYGDGPARPALADRIDRHGMAGHITLRGHTGVWRASSDLLVSACEVEAFGRVVIEAGMAAIPQIVPDRGGSAELVMDEITGLRYDPTVPGALTEALARAAAWDTPALTHYAWAARAHARRFDITGYAAAYTALAHDLTAHAALPAAA